ncbi:MAG: hypothetical protein E6K75_08325 [Candidatus Eisenbacteria bacterium]|uniref:Uncharacterized protein n=1 Tax=Eiseniibacteriota bacterium TaxID=2212470 RepID=A0A538SYU6_UNCEI|nr:MAG: hypothetical protein E6K75_08325 [Candidatus Eisenbacteria bacterium]
MPAAREDAETEVPAAPPGAERFPRGELLLACALALILRLLYLAGAAKSPLFTHPALEEGFVLHLPRLVQCLLDVGSVFFLGATAWELWGRRPAILTAEIAALYGPLIYFQAEPGAATPGFFLIASFLYLTMRAARSGSAGRSASLGFLLAVATALALACAGAGAAGAGHASSASGAGIAAHAPLRFLENALLAWNRREVPCGMDQRFLAAHNSPMFRLPWLLSFAFVGPIALVAAWAERRRVPLLTGYLVVVTLAIAAAQVCDRTRLPLLAAAIPLAGIGIDRFLAAFARAARKTRVWPAAALLEVACAHGRTLIALGLRAGDAAAALRAYAEAEREGLRSAELYAAWGALEQSVRQGVEGEKHLLLAINLDPGNAPAHMALGDIYLERESFAQAAQEYGITAELVPARAAEFCVRAGEAYEGGRDLQRAVSMYERALRIRPGYEPARRGLEGIGKGGSPEPPVKMFPPLVR